MLPSIIILNVSQEYLVSEIIFGTGLDWNRHGGTAGSIGPTPWQTNKTAQVPTSGAFYHNVCHRDRVPQPSAWIGGRRGVARALTIVERP